MDQLLDLLTIRQMRKALRVLPKKIEEAYESSVKRTDAQPNETASYCSQTDLMDRPC